jgi:adenylate cyclase
LRPDRDIAFFQVFPPHTSAAHVRRTTGIRVGEERYIVSMFVDMRRSTAMAEKRLPFDTMFIINRFVGAVSAAIEDAGGRPNQFVGDGLLALFGVDKDPAIACREAIDALARISANVDQLNHDLAHDLREPIRYGIGVNGGEVIIGDIGYRDQIVFTALGDPVNVAARLQEHAAAGELLVGDGVDDERMAGRAREHRTLALRGRDAAVVASVLEV